MKKIAIYLGVIIILIALAALMTKKAPDNQEQVVLEKTLNISREYVSLRYQTDNLLLSAQDYAEYNDWNSELSGLNLQWVKLAEGAKELEGLALEMSNKQTSYNFVIPALAYTREEINNVFDKAPAGKKIATLAKHLGVDAKLAHAILNQTQNETQADLWNKEGDTFKKLETAAVVVKDGCKVVGFVGAVALTGGTAGLAASGTLAKTAVVVAGADLALEVTDDGAKIALGDKNKVSSIVGSARTVTEPVAAILMISTLPNNLSKGIEKLSAVTFGAESLNTVVQEGKIIGIKLPTYTKEPNKKTSEFSVMENEELEQWAKEQGISLESPTVAEVEEVLGLNKTNVQQNISEVSNQENVGVKNEDSGSENSDSPVGAWEGILKFTPSQTESERQVDYSIELRADGTVGGSFGESYERWEQLGSAVRLFASSEDGEGYDEFSVSGNSMTYVKRAGINSEGEWQEDYAGSDFFGGKFMEISLRKK